MTDSLRAAIAAASLALAPLACQAQDVIHVAFGERPPYLTTQPDGTPAGLTGTPAAQAFKAAGIPVQWHRVPANRQLMMVRDAQAMNCAIGWFNVPERASFTKLSKPIYRDRGWAILTNSEFAARGHTSLAELMRHRDIRLLVKDNYSYGNLDALIRQWQPTIAVSTAPAVKMLQSVSTGMVDMMFVTEDEGRYLLRGDAGAHTANLRLLLYKDMPHGAERHIMCSKAVPDEVMARLNKAITFK